MAEAIRPDSSGVARKEAVMSSGILTELPTIAQARSLGGSTLTPINSDQIDFATKATSPRRSKTTDNEPTDYLNGGLPHEKVSPVSEDGAASGPSTQKSDQNQPPAPADPTSDADEVPEMPSPALHRRSVQFARDDVIFEPPAAHSRQGSMDTRDAGSKLRGTGFMARLKELAGPSISGSSKSPAFAPGELGSTASSPTVTRQSTRVPRTLDEGSDIDADAEETADENALGPAKSKKKKRRMRRPKMETQSTPNTPAMVQDTPSAAHGRLGFMRRSTMPDVADRGGLSEGEGRDQLTRERGGMVRGNSWFGNRNDEAEDAESPSGQRRIGGHMRRISGFGGGASDGDAMTPRKPFFGAERASTFGVQKWRQVKNTLKLLRQKKDEQFDYYKSAELMAELRAGAPAVLMLASMIQRDEHGNKRIPVLLEQLKVRIRDSAPVQGKDSERHWLFTIDLEYGSGPSRMKWTIKRTIRDILNLHWKYKLTLGNEKFPTNRLDLGAKPKQPSFPLSAFPYLRGVRGLDDNDEEEPATPAVPDSARVLGEETAGEGTAGEATVAEGTDAEDRPPMRKKRSRMAVLGGRRKNSAFGSTADFGQTVLDAAAARRRYVERQQKMLEKYLQEMIRWLMFRADSNRLCRFLELSALGVRLAAEGSYHGKECYLHIQSSKGLDFRRVLTPQKVIARHTRKWFLVRQSYIVCVESPENMNIYDVYLVDPTFMLVSKGGKGKHLTAETPKAEDDIENLDLTAQPAEKHHTLKIVTSERKIKLFSRSQHLIQQFEESIIEMLRSTPWHLKNRFDSFAPVRTGVHAQWLVDGRDYMWNVSRAINMARDVIYIHDWWLSPELYMRRPACISQKWRLDRLLQKKAKEGVKIFIIVYRNVEAAVPIDSEYTKFSLLNLHPNIFVQRSPNQFKKNQFFFAHHEKICIVDHDVAFVGGIDLCFGRWDCPQHPVADDKPTGFEAGDNPKDAEHCQLFPGKDYSNPRVQDFFRLNEPYEEMYDRGRVPRMPWHDIAMQVVGQPARDLTRHFVQRWNYVRRGRKPTRPTPFLLPPPDYKKEDLDALGLTGTCEVQILRSASTWSLGIKDTEHSIQSAYIKMIEDSDHLVYIENQFFITSTETLNNKMVNRIGDALVERIIRAHQKDEDWKAIILIPLMPGFQNEVNEQDGTSIRLILQCQYRSICRGEHSIFGRLRAAGIDPEDYISFFSLRQWGKLGNNILSTEQLYIHAKCIIVDDRVALIGSANINERSMLGERDSECAAIVRDTDMIWSTMAGRPYRVGRFAHTLRLRLMREHLGLDVDEILEEERQADLDREADFEAEMDDIYSEQSDADADASPVVEGSSRRRKSTHQDPLSPLKLHITTSINKDVLDLDFNSATSAKGKSPASDVEYRDIDIETHKKDVEGFGPDHWKDAQKEDRDQGRDSVVINGREVLINDISPEGKGTLHSPKEPHEIRRFSDAAAHHHEDGNGGPSNHGIPPMPAFDRRTTEQLGLPRANQLSTLPVMDDTDIGGPPVHMDSMTGKPTNQPHHNPLVADIKLADISKDCMRDPLNPSFYEDIWCRAAENNTKIYRRVFRCMPDSEATNWAEYKEFKAYNQRFKESMDGHKSDEDPNAGEVNGPPQKQAAAGAGIGAPGPANVAKTLTEKFAAPVAPVAGKVVGALGGDHSKNVNSPVSDEAVHDEKRAQEADDKARADSPGDAEKADGGLERIQSPPTAFPAFEDGTLKPPAEQQRQRRTTFEINQEKPENLRPPNSSASHCSATTGLATENGGNGNGDKKPLGSQRRRRRATTRGSRGGKGGFNPMDELLSKMEAEELLNMTQGTLVQFPYDWLIVEETNGNWLFQVDQVAPLQIYN
ncbi:phospholipase D1 [Diplogelasinospora grovesii]|uniref:Phospholipase D1 n=1 Tax=Diplogelasinospora grovesii TaxID=303347 RepID=A0AAN6MYI8_9PEZI|nr:phospholipase D1 [Diplogelasinospora grovesii]